MPDYKAKTNEELQEMIKGIETTKDSLNELQTYLVETLEARQSK